MSNVRQNVKDPGKHKRRVDTCHPHPGVVGFPPCSTAGSYRRLSHPGSRGSDCGV